MALAEREERIVPAHFSGGIFAAFSAVIAVKNELANVLLAMAYVDRAPLPSCDREPASSMQTPAVGKGDGTLAEEGWRCVARKAPARSL
jgi:hypothetical protein